MNDLGKIALAAVCLLTPPAAGSAADLRVVGSNADMEVSVDVDTIKTIEGSHTEVVVFTQYSRQQEAPGVPNFDATLSRVLLRCITFSGSIATLAFFNDAKLVRKFDYDEIVWRQVDPATDIGQVWKYICTRQWEKDGPNKR